MGSKQTKKPEKTKAVQHSFPQTLNQSATVACTPSKRPEPVHYCWLGILQQDTGVSMQMRTWWQTRARLQLGVDSFGAEAITAPTNANRTNVAMTGGVGAAVICTAVGLGSFCAWLTTFATAFGTTASRDRGTELSSLQAELNSSNAFTEVLLLPRAESSTASTYCRPPRFLKFNLRSRFPLSSLRLRSSRQHIDSFSLFII